MNFKKFFSIFLSLLVIFSTTSVFPVHAATYTPGYEEDFDNIRNWSLKAANDISMKNGTIITSGKNVPEAYLKGDFSKWDKYTFTTEFSRSNLTGNNTWSRIYLGGFSILIRAGSISYLHDGGTEVGVGAFKQEANKHYKLKVERDKDKAKVYMMATDDNRYSEITTITNLKQGSNYGVSSLNLATTFYSFKFESKDKKDMWFDKPYYDLSVGQTVKLNLVNNSGLDVSYSVDKADVAEIDSDGNLTVKDKGYVNVTAETSNGIVAQTVVNCVKVIDKITLSNTVLDLKVGESADLLATVSSDATEKDLIFEVSDNKIIDLNGESMKRRNVEARSPGSAKVIVKGVMGDAVAECIVNVSDKYEKQTRNVSIKVDGAVQPLHKTVFGPNWEQLSRVSSTNDFVTELDVEFFKDIKIQSTRGPGGYECNKWIALEGTSHESADAFYKRKEGLNGFFIEDFYEMPETLDIPAVLNLQITYNSIEDIKEIIRRARASTDKTLYIELGNEYYDNHWMKDFPTAQAYMDKCREVAKAIRSVDDNVQIGVMVVERAMERRIVSDPNNQLKEGKDGIMWGETFIGRIYNWNAIVAQNPDVYDAVIPHAYAELANTNGMTQKNMIEHLAASAEEIYEGLLYQSLQYPGKQIWVTEWGSLGGAIFTEGDMAERARMNFLKLPGQALHHLERLFDMVKTGVVTFAAYHTPIDGQGFGLVNDNIEAKLPNYYVFKEIGEIIDRNDTYYDIDTSGSGEEIFKLYFTQNFVQEVDNIAAYGFGDESGIKEAVLINHTPDEMVVSIENLKLKKIWEYGNGSEPFAGWGKKILEGGWKGMPIANPSAKTNFADVYGDSVTIPPYSAVTVAVQGDMNAIELARTLPKTSNAELYKQQNMGDVTSAVILEINNPVAFVSSQKKQIDVNNTNVVPQLINDRTFVPLRFIAEAMGSSVDYDNGVITINDSGNEIRMTIGETEAIMNDKPLTMNSAPVIIEDRTLVPIRAISEMLAKQVYWVDGRYVVISTEILDVDNNETINKIKVMFQ